MALTGTAAGAAPPGIPSAATARSDLARLTVALPGAGTGYRSDLFPHWHTVSGTCNTRETVLKRDGTGVITNASCTATAGTWRSPYDGAVWRAASDVDISHVISYKNAWISGASSWTTSKREAFANDLVHPQLVVVTDNLNAARGDRSPDVWKPPLASFHCTYARMWISVKFAWRLKITSREKAALITMLNTC